MVIEGAQASEQNPAYRPSASYLLLTREGALPLLAFGQFTRGYLETKESAGFALLAERLFRRTMRGEFVSMREFPQ
jgi:hypothetical protein